jgi:hypothetical protein
MAESLEDLQRVTFGYFVHETNPLNGLVPDNTRLGAPCSIAAVGLGLAAYPVAVERGIVTRADAARRVRKTLRFFRDSPQGEDPDATGHKGFYYHFLDMKTGRRVWRCELSTVDSTFLLAGALSAGVYFDRDTALEREVRETAEDLYRRADWEWALDEGLLVSHGWRPESGFIRHRWDGYSEALLLYILGLGSPTHPLPAASYDEWTRSYRWRRLYEIDFLFARSLFEHQLSHMWIDFRGIQDAFMRDKGIDYFENTRRATHVQREYAKRNTRGFRGYGEDCWGVTASDGPGPAVLVVDGVRRRFWDYRARGVPDGPDDGTIAPWASIASLPFAPDIVLRAMDHFYRVYPQMTSHYGFKCSFNPTCTRGTRGGAGWIAKGYIGLDQGPIVCMIENHLSGMFWEMMRTCDPIRTGLSRAGFSGGWLERP